MIGKLFGNRYEIIAKLGAGGMANVYKARCTILNRIVTVKILRSELAEDKDFVRRFQNEAQAVALLSHPNIVSIYDVGEENGLPYLVMEYVEGKNLKELIRSEGALSPSEVVNIGIQVCAALGHAHSKGIIHRDVKPHNILVAPEGQIKVTDFGLARFLSVPSATMTQSGTVMGSVHYFSPEQARGEEADAQSDIYSLGTVLYEAVSGHVPFQGDSPVSIALKHLQEEPPGLHIENQSIPKELEQIIMKAMAKKPELRFLSAEEMQGALDNIDGFSAPEEELTRAIPIPVIPEKKTVKKRKLHPAAIAAIVVGILLLFAGMGYAFFAWYFGGTGRGICIMLGHPFFMFDLVQGKGARQHSLGRQCLNRPAWLHLCSNYTGKILLHLDLLFFTCVIIIESYDRFLVLILRALIWQWFFLRSPAPGKSGQQHQECCQIDGRHKRYSLHRKFPPLLLYVVLV
jgi:tRNA A-37 threonylcarbamoyl transferase component Bud32